MKKILLLLIMLMSISSISYAMPADTDSHWDGHDFLATCSGALVYEVKF